MPCVACWNRGWLREVFPWTRCICACPREVLAIRAAGTLSRKGRPSSGAGACWCGSMVTPGSLIRLVAFARKGWRGASQAGWVRHRPGGYLADGAADLRPGAAQPMPPETRASLGDEEDGAQWNPALWLHNVRRGNIRPGPEVMWSLARMGLVDA